MYDPPIICCPRLQRPAVRWLYKVLVIGAWVGWLGLVAPLALWLLGCLGAGFLVMWMVPVGELLTEVTIAVLLMAGLILAWSLYRRITGRGRREWRRVPVRAGAVAAFFGVKVDAVRRMRTSRRMVLYLSAEGSPVELTVASEKKEEGARRISSARRCPMPGKPAPVWLQGFQSLRTVINALPERSPG